MFSIAALYTLLFLLLISYAFDKWNSYRAFQAASLQHGCQRPPRYPHRDPIWGTDLLNEHMAAIREGRLMSLYMDHYRLYGKTWEQQFFTTKIINTMDMRNIQEVMALSFQDYGKPSRKLFSEFIGDGIFAQDGPAWKHSRDLVKPIFSRSELLDVDRFGRHADRFLGMIPGDGTTVDLQLPLHKLFLDASTEFLFGDSIDSQLSENPHSSTEFLKAFSYALEGVGKRRTAGILAPLKYAFNTSWKKAYKIVHAFIDKHVNRALEETTPNSNIKAVDGDRKNRYVLLNEMVKQIRDPVVLRFQVLNVFVAARDTTSILIGNALFHLARNPEIWIQLRKESLNLGDKDLTFEILKSLKLFRYVVQETQRLQGPSGRVGRIAIRNTILPVGGGSDGKAPIFVEKGTHIASNIWCLHNDRDTWGEDVDVFRPQRWVDRKPLWEFIPFLGGPRICPAQQQVLTQAIYLLKAYATVRHTAWAGVSSTRLLALSSSLLALSTAAIVLRFYSRKIQKAVLKTDDWLMIPTLLFLAGSTGVAFYGVRRKVLGYPTPNDTAEAARTAPTASKLYLAFDLLSTGTLGCIKLSALFFYYRIFCVMGQSTAFAKIIICSVVIVLLWIIAFMVLVGLSCGSHLSALWSSRSIFIKYCHVAYPYLLSFAITDFLLDFWVLCLPVPQQEYLLKLNRGFGACVARMAIYIELERGGPAVPRDPRCQYRSLLSSYKSSSHNLVTNTRAIFLSVLEAGLSCIAVNLPSLYFLLNKITPENLLRSMRSIISLGSLRSNNSQENRVSEPNSFPNARKIPSASNSSQSHLTRPDAVPLETHAVQFLKLRTGYNNKVLGNNLDMAVRFSRFVEVGALKQAEFHL
ncbi:hypothetical protein B7494_g6984 [Chlorociboria aeruginascens]|nr:hypothetical protein B7494_g6984 [Chlorociboria aeruginascens]